MDPLAATVLFIAHAAAAAFCFSLIRGSPCWIQAIVITMFGVTMSIASGAYLVEILGFDDAYRREMMRLAVRLEHWVVLLFVFRLYHTGNLTWTSLPRSRSSSP